MIVRQKTERRRADHRLAAFVTDQPGITANRTQRHAHFQRTQRTVRFRSRPFRLRNIKTGHHQCACRPTLLSRNQMTRSPEQIAARIRHQRFRTAANVASSHTRNPRNPRVKPPIQHTHLHPSLLAITNDQPLPGIPTFAGFLSLCRLRLADSP